MDQKNSDSKADHVLGNVPLFYRGRASNPLRDRPLPQPVRFALDIPSLYDPDEPLIAAANAALVLRLPLLLTGKPGTGKTELARNLAIALHGTMEGRLFEVSVTSTTDRADLLYRYDELSRLRDAYAAQPASPPRRHAEAPGSADGSSPYPGGDNPPAAPALPPPDKRVVFDRDYLELRGLGAAIVAAGKPDDLLAPILPGRPMPAGLTTLADLLGPAPTSALTLPTTPSGAAIAGNTPAYAQPDPRAAFFLPPGSPPPVVLIDEIDKAPRELPNDLLNELDRMRFSIPEIGVRVSLGDAACWPIVVITSNAERPLSDAFLRRCICFEVEVPGPDRLKTILESKLRALRVLDDPGQLPGDVVAFVERLWASRDIEENEKPGTARILDFAMLLADPSRFGGRQMHELPEPLRRAALTALLPSRGAQTVALKVWNEWKSTPSP